ncbi:prolipoprotein diacylglyceryl transferase [Terrihalobacillus insolitus]|uniref:prolipoprotein diacylglyceryl transferase n=1 Tax=Terrihalobacillus insolitus TaxID=2950438 RepID=UPI0023400DF0|nr:prolipoprotein diacylglyceryl transferase [Terrihalobacillus insolitus]MDC3412939.1 prolipoprotein diacylglyceryl transferase [Terrihalobacillus insolitus]
MYKDLFTIFGYTIQTHAVISVIAIIVGYGVAITMMKGTKYQSILDHLIFYLLIGAIIGARFWHVFVFQWPYYSQHPLKILMIWQGGISILGAIVGGIAALIIYVYKHKLDFWELADYLAPPMILAMGIGRAACLFSGGAFGSPTGSSFGMVFPEGTIAYEYYGSQPLWPAVIWESQGDILIFAILFYVFGKQLFKGSVFTLFIFLYGMERFLLSFFRGDSPQYALGLTAGQWTSVALMVIAVILAIFIFVKYRFRKPRENVTG